MHEKRGSHVAIASHHVHSTREDLLAYRAARLTVDPVTLDQLLVFRCVAEEGSFSAAARRLGRAQSAVSYAIANLERLLELELFERGGRRAVLSDAGRALLADATAVVQHADRLIARASRLAAGVEAQLGLAVDCMVPRAALVAALGEFRAAYPEIELHLHVEIFGGVARLVTDGMCDVGIGSPLTEIPAELEHRAFAGIPMWAVAAHTHPLAKHRGIVPEHELEGHVQMILADRSGTANEREGAIVQRIWRIADLDTMRELVLAGFGWAGLPLHIIDADLRESRLVRILPGQWAEREYEFALNAMWRRAAPPGPAGTWLLGRLSHTLAAPKRAGGA